MFYRCLRMNWTHRSRLPGSGSGQLRTRAKGLVAVQRGWAFRQEGKTKTKGSDERPRGQGVFCWSRRKREERGPIGLREGQQGQAVWQQGLEKPGWSRNVQRKQGGTRQLRADASFKNNDGNECWCNADDVVRWNARHEQNAKQKTKTQPRRK